MSLLDRIKSRLQLGKTGAHTDLEQTANHLETEMANLSGYESRYTEVSAAPSANVDEDLEYMTLPLIGRRPIGVVRNIGFAVIAISAIAFIALSALTITRSNNVSAQVAATGDALMQSQRLAKSVSLAMVGDAQGIKDVNDSYKALDSRVNALENGNADIRPLGSQYQGDIKAIDGVEPGCRVVLGGAGLLHLDLEVAVGVCLRAGVLALDSKHPPVIEGDVEVMLSVEIERSEERRVGKECPSLCRSRWSPYH